MANPSDSARGLPVDSDRSWSVRDHAVFVATVVLGAFLPPAVAFLDGGRPWQWVLMAVAATWYVTRSRRTGGVGGVTTPGGKRFLYAAFWFYVTATATIGAIAVFVGPAATTDPAMTVSVLAPAGAIGTGTWVRRSRDGD
jgi:hypothetical protein